MKQFILFIRKASNQWILLACMLFVVQLLPAQNVNNARFTMKQNDVQLENVLTRIQTQTGCKIFYNSDLVKDIRIDIDVKNEKLNLVLDKVLKGTSLSFTIEKNTIIIFKAEVKKDSKKTGVRNIFGTVKDENGDPLIGATVRTDQSTGGTITDISGGFMTAIPDDAKYLIVSFIGMETKEIKIDDSNVFTIIMEENKRMLSDVVVTGYQTIDRRDMVGAYTSLKAEDVLMPNYTSIDQMLQGQVAGLMVTNTSTRTGASPTITLRGVSTLHGTTSPIWVVDGVIQEDVASLSSKNPMLSSANGNDIAQLTGSAISWLNPNDIESIVVLKDASATAIYGSRASNGVIVITTKKGQGDRLSVRYSNSTTISPRPTYDDYYVMNSKERINFSKEAFDAGAYYQRTPLAQMYTYEGMMQLYLAGSITEDQFVKQYKNLETVNTDWLDLVTRTTVSHQHNLALSGKSKNMTYNTSFNYAKTQGTEKGNDQEMFSGRIRLGLEASSRLKFDFSLNGVVSSNNGFAAEVNPQNFAISTSRAIPAYEEDGSYSYYQKYADYGFNSDVKNEGLKYNILNEMNNTYTKVKSPQFNATFNAQWNILGNDLLRYEFVAGYSNYNSNTESYADERSFFIAKDYRGYDYNSIEDLHGDPRYKAAMLPHGGMLTKRSSSRWSYNLQNKLLFSKTINTAHRLNAMAAFEVRSNTTDINEYSIFGYLGGKGKQIVTPPPPDKIVPLNSTSQGWGLMNYMYENYELQEQTENFVSAFASFAYSYDNRYIFNFNIRNDASNRFGQDVNRQFDPTYSFGFSWRASEESFFSVLKPYLSTMALKATYGIQGNVLTNYSPELILFWPELSEAYKQYISSIKSIPNPLLDWERTKSWNWGVNIGLFNDKVMLDIDGYLRNSKPLSQYPLTPEYGGKNIMQNGAELQNSGIEVTAKFSPIVKKDIKLGMSVNFSKNWNEVKGKSTDKQRSITTNLYIQGNSNNGAILEKGYPIDGFWVYDFDKLNPINGYAQFNKMDMTDYNSIADFLYYAGSSNPVMSAGININFSYKSLTLNTGLAANLGGKRLLPNPYSNFYKGSLPSPDVNLNKELIYRWRNPGDENYTTIPAVYTGNSAMSITDPSGTSNDIYSMWAASSDRIVSKSFLRCRQISLSWYAPQTIIKPMGLSRLSLSATASNIFVLASSRYKGMDPETGTSVLPRSFSFGLNVSF